MSVINDINGNRPGSAKQIHIICCSKYAHIHQKFAPAWAENRAFLWDESIMKTA